MTSLLWKDYRLNRPLLILCATVCGLLYFVGVVTQIAATWPGLPSSSDWASMFVSYGAVGMYLTICFAGLFGGYAIACERGDRTVHFLRCLPPTKAQILASKFVVSAGATAGLWGWILLTRYIIPSALSPQRQAVEDIVTIPGVLSVCILTFGVGWAASAILEGSTIPILVALISPVAVSIGLILFGSLFRIPQIRVSEWSNLVSFGTGLLAFLAGTWYYCRRIDP